MPLDKLSYKTFNKYYFLLIIKLKLIANGEIGNMESVPKLAEEECEPTLGQKESKKALVEFVLENQLQMRNATPKIVLVWYFHNSLMQRMNFRNLNYHILLKIC